MKNLLLFLVRFQGLLAFGVLEVFSLYLFVTSSSYQRAAFFNSANTYAGAMLARRAQVLDYFHLGALNQQLMAENARLRQQLYPPDRSRREADSLAVPSTPGDSLHRVRYQRPARRPDTLLLAQRRLAAHDPDYPLIPARVINNSLRNVDNYITLNVGLVDGVHPGLGVLAATGVVGRIKAATAHYATATSLLHSKTSVSAKIKRDGTFGSVRWPGDDPTQALLDDVPRQNKLLVGDTVVTSGYNAIFPEGVLVGTVSSFVKEPDKNFWTVHLRLGVDFSNLTYVYVVTSRTRSERDTVEAHALPPVGRGGRR